MESTPPTPLGGGYGSGPGYLKKVTYLSKKKRKKSAMTSLKKNQLKLYMDPLMQIIN